MGFEQERRETTSLCRKFKQVEPRGSSSIKLTPQCRAGSLLPCVLGLTRWKKNGFESTCHESSVALRCKFAECTSTAGALVETHIRADCVLRGLGF